MVSKLIDEDKQEKDFCVTRKCVYITVVTLLSIIILYLWQINWFFERKLESLANVLVRAVMQDGYYKVNKSEVCSMTGGLMNAGIGSLFNKIADDDNYVITTVAVNECSSQVLRMNGDEKIDIAFNNKDAIKCKTDIGYRILTETAQFTRSLLKKNKNFRFYTIYTKTDCLNHKILDENAATYTGQVLKRPTASLGDAPIGRFWILYNNDYYYFFAETNGLQGYVQDVKQEHYQIFKKLTLDELMHFDNGSYWRLIKEHGIQID